jgi:hypothetical protein
MHLSKDKVWRLYLLVNEKEFLLCSTLVAPNQDPEVILERRIFANKEAMISYRGTLDANLRECLFYDIVRLRNSERWNDKTCQAWINDGVRGSCLDYIDGYNEYSIQFIASCMRELVLGIEEEWCRRDDDNRPWLVTREFVLFQQNKVQAEISSLTEKKRKIDAYLATTSNDSSI